MLCWRHSVIVTLGWLPGVGLGWMVFNMQLVVIIVILFIYTRKRGKAQRVARPACANATLHFLLTYRLVMLLSNSEWPLKTSTQRILTYVRSPPMQMCHKISRVTGPKFTKFLPDIEGLSSMLTQRPTLRSSQQWSNASGENADAHLGWQWRIFIPYTSCSGRRDVGQRNVKILQLLQSDRRSGVIAISFSRFNFLITWQINTG